MDVGPYLVEAHLREGRRVADLARVHGVHRSWLYKLLSRYRAQGEAGLAPRSRRPHRSPTALPSELAVEKGRRRENAVWHCGVIRHRPDFGPSERAVQTVSFAPADRVEHEKRPTLAPRDLVDRG